MAEYYPLLAKAVAGLPESTREARQALYERARNALLNQLRNLQPPIAEADIARETEALAAAAAKLEAEFDAKALAANVGSLRGSLLDPASKRPAGPGAPAFQPAPSRPVVPRRSEAETQAAPQQFAPSVSPRNARGIDRAADKVNEERKSEFTLGSSSLGGSSLGSSQLGSLSGSGQSSAQDGPVALKIEDSANVDLAAQLLLKPRPEMSRPYAPQPPDEVEERPHRRLWIVGLILALFVASIAVAAWKLRDKPEELVRVNPEQQVPIEPPGSKIVERIGGTPPQAQTPVASTALPAATTQETRPRIDSQPPVPVSQRAALLVESPDEANKVKTYVGTVVWHLDNVSNGPGQPLGTAVHADVDIPEAKLKVAMIFQKNFDAGLPASHTMTLLFVPAPDSPLASVKAIKVPYMRGLEAQVGDALGGIPVSIMENSFLVGLWRGASEVQNLELIRQREWVDVPMTLSNGRAAKLTFEKSTTGARVIEDAITAWKSQ